jgi:hypothetical protein
LSLTERTCRPPNRFTRALEAAENPIALPGPTMGDAAALVIRRAEALS